VLKLDLKVIGDKIETMVLDAVYRWDVMLEKVMKYIDENEKRPANGNKNIEIRSMGKWIYHQQENYTQHKYNMKNQSIYTKWKYFLEEYEEYFMSNEEEWINKLMEVKKNINENKKKPSSSKTQKNINNCIYLLGCWIDTQIANYKNNKKNMKKSNIKKIWEEFIIEYKQYFISSEEEWKNNLIEVKFYIEKNKKRPSQIDKIKDIQKLGSWINTQLINYEKKQYIMKKINIREQWEKFILEYKQYFILNEDEWKNNLTKIKDYILKFNKRPSEADSNEDISYLGKWISHQLLNFKKNIGIMKNNYIKKEWNEFINNYKKYFLSFDEIWKNKLLDLKKYINEYKKRPSPVDKNKEIQQLGSWINMQLYNYKNNKKNMKDLSIRKTWEEFIKEYIEYFPNIIKDNK